MPSVYIAFALLFVLAGCAPEVRVVPDDATRYNGEPALDRARSLARSVETVAAGWGNKGRQWAVERRAEELGLGKSTRVEWVDWWTPQKNVIIDLPATVSGPADLVFVTAHYDKIDLRPDAMISRLLLDIPEPLLSWSYTTSGAVDNATGVAVVLELARALSAQPRRHDYRFVLFASEESGLRGARCYVAGLPEEDIFRTRLAVNLDSVGVEGAPNGVIDDGREPALVTRAARIAERRGFPLERWGLPRWLATSDDDVFWATSTAIDVLRGFAFNLALFFLPQRSWFTDFKHVRTIAFVSPGCFDWTDVAAALTAIPVGTIHGPRDRAGRVDAWRLYEQYEIARELIEDP